MRLPALVLPLLAAAPAFAQAPPPAGRWVVERSSECLVSLRDATPVWRVRLDILRTPGGNAAVIIGINDPAAATPRRGEDRLHVVWVAADGAERGHDLPLAGVRAAAGPGRPLMAHSLVRGGPGLDRMLAAGMTARTIRLSLPGAGPYDMPSPGLAEAWAESDGCAPP